MSEITQEQHDEAQKQLQAAQETIAAFNGQPPPPKPVDPKFKRGDEVLIRAKITNCLNPGAENPRYILATADRPIICHEEQLTQA